MEYRQFGRTDLQVSTIGFGCWEMGGGYGSIDETEIIAAINRAVDLGINCFDTAEGYGKGKSEELLARALGDRRKDVIVVTKFGIGYDNDRSKGRDSRPEMVYAAIERSLKWMNTDYVDVYLVHWPDRQTPFDETMRALEDIVQQGKVRYVGLSNFQLGEIKQCMAARRVDVLQYACNLFDRRMAKWIFPYAEEHGIGVMTYGSLAYGMLSGAFTEETTFEENDWRGRGGSDMSLKLFLPGIFQRNVQAVNEVKAIAEGLGKTLPQLALRWVHSQPAVSVSLVGARRASEVEENIKAIGWDLTDDVNAAIDAVFAKYEIDTAPNKWTEAVE
jgi:aryl-alcohol dehydrogenase-like predicted oxidoreductase